MFNGFWIGLFFGAVMSQVGPAPTITVVGLGVIAVACVVERWWVMKDAAS